MRKIIFIFSILLFLFCLWFVGYWGIFAPMTITHTGAREFVLRILRDELLPYLSLLIFIIVLPFIFVIAAFKFMRNKTNKKRWPRIYLIIFLSLFLLYLSAGFLVDAFLGSIDIPLWQIVILDVVLFIIFGFPIRYLIKAKGTQQEI